MQNEEARLRRILPETKQPIFCIPNVSTSTRLGPISLTCTGARTTYTRGKRRAGEEEKTLTVTLPGSGNAPPEYERLVKRSKIGMGEEGPSGDRKVLPQHSLEYKKDEEESEGEAYLLDSEEERMAGWASCYSCDYCGRMATNTSFPYCSENCREREWDAMQQERDNHYDFLCASTDSLLTSIFCD